MIVIKESKSQEIRKGEIERDQNQKKIKGDRNKAKSQEIKGDRGKKNRSYHKSHRKSASLQLIVIRRTPLCDSGLSIIIKYC